MKKYLLLSLLLVAAIVYLRLSFYTVDAAEYVYVTVLGKHEATYDGADPQDGAGLKFGWAWPIRQVQRLDRRLQHFDLPEQEQLTHDPVGKTVDKILVMEAYVCWKIAEKKPNDKGDSDPVDRFVRRIGTALKAREILAPQINGRLGAAIGQMRMDDLVNASPIDPATGQTRVDAALETLREQLLLGLRDRFREEYGIELVDIRLRRFNHPERVRGPFSSASRPNATRKRPAMKATAKSRPATSPARPTNKFAPRWPTPGPRKPPSSPRPTSRRGKSATGRIARIRSFMNFSRAWRTCKASSPARNRFSFFQRATLWSKALLQPPRSKMNAVPEKSKKGDK